MTSAPVQVSVCPSLYLFVNPRSCDPYDVCVCLLSLHTYLCLFPSTVSFFLLFRPALYFFFSISYLLCHPYFSLSLSFFKELNGSCSSENNNSIRVLRQLAGHRHHHCRQNKFVRNKKQIVAPPPKKRTEIFRQKMWHGWWKNGRFGYQWSPVWIQSSENEVCKKQKFQHKKTCILAVTVACLVEEWPEVTTLNPVVGKRSM